MRKEYTAALRELFTQELAQVCTQFTLVNKHLTLFGFPGERAYCWHISPTLYSWVVLIPDAKREAFYIEVGWSNKSRFPQLTMRPSMVQSSSAVAEDEYLCRLGELARGNDCGWVIEELPAGATQQAMIDYITAQTKKISSDQARSKVLPCVKVAIKELVEHGISFLTKHIQSVGTGRSSN